jgi:putative acetyltransferase
VETFSHPAIAVRQAVSPEQVEHARQLFLEYAESLGFSLCFQGFDEELKNLPGAYISPQGRLLLAQVQHQLAGCVALRPIDSQTCEMKRLFVRPSFRGQGIGRVLVDGIIAEARGVGYERLRLDTVGPSMKDAVALYRRRGFREIEPYRDNPMAGVHYMELSL